MAAKKTTKPRSRKGMMPGQYRKRSTVFVERLRKNDEEARYTDDDLMTTDAYIVQTNRLDGSFDHTVELKGVMMRLPGKVVDRLIAQRDAIIKEGRSDRARTRHEQLVATAQADQYEAESEEERARDLKGF